MKLLGYLLVCVGILYLFIAFNMDVSIETQPIYVPGAGSFGGGKIANLDLMAQRQNHLIIAALTTLVGVLLAIFANDGSRNSSEGVEDEINSIAADFEGIRSINSDAYRLWLAKHFQIERNEVFDKFVLRNKTFDTLDDALVAAHNLEQKRLADEAAEIQRLQAEALAVDEAAKLSAEIEEAKWQEQKPKLIIGVVLFIVSATILILFIRETPQERIERQAREQAQALEYVKKVEKRFGVSIPADAVYLKITENAADYPFFCNNSKTGTLLEFQTNLPEKEVKDLFAKSLGKGTAKYDHGDNFDWKWQKNKRLYELSMLNETPLDVNFCVID